MIDKVTSAAVNPIREVTGHSDCLLWDSDGENECGLKCPQWYRHPTGSWLSGEGNKTYHCRVPRNCPIKTGDVIIRWKGR